jgi:hypothetical protein
MRVSNSTRPARPPQPSWRIRSRMTRIGRSRCAVCALVQHPILAAAVAGDPHEPRRERAEGFVQGYCACRQRGVAVAPPLPLRPPGRTFLAKNARTRAIASGSSSRCAGRFSACSSFSRLRLVVVTIAVTARSRSASRGVLGLRCPVVDGGAIEQTNLSRRLCSWAAAPFRGDDHRWRMLCAVRNRREVADCGGRYSPRPAALSRARSPLACRAASTTPASPATRQVPARR